MRLLPTLILIPLLSPLALACGTIPPQLWTLTRNAAIQVQLEPELLGSLVWAESRYCVDAESPKGALGLGQLLPETAVQLGVDPLDPAQNLLGAARYLREQLDTFGSLNLALAAYNAGPGAVNRYGGVPPFAETERYVGEVQRLYAVFLTQKRTIPRQDAAGSDLRVYARRNP